MVNLGSALFERLEDLSLSRSQEDLSRVENYPLEFLNKKHVSSQGGKNALTESVIVPSKSCTNFHNFGFITIIINYPWYTLCTHHQWVGLPSNASMHERAYYKEPAPLSTSYSIQHTHNINGTVAIEC